MNPPMDTVPRAFRKYTPPVRSPRDDKTLRTVASRLLTPSWNDSSTSTIFCSPSATAPFAGPRRTTKSRVCSASCCRPKKMASSPKSRSSSRCGPCWCRPISSSFRTQRQRIATTDSVPIDDFALASRISYFLWSSMPDEQLFRVAAQGLLRRPEILARSGQTHAARSQGARTRRELRQPVAPDAQARQLHPRSGTLPRFRRVAQSGDATETELFFESIRDKDRSVLEFLDADYTFVNERLARHYGLAGRHGRLVSPGRRWPARRGAAC